MEPQVSHNHLTHYLRDKYHKALTRFEKGLESGRFASYSKQKKAQIWNRLNRYAKQLGIALRPGLIAACLAAGLCFSSAASAQPFTAQTGPANPLNGVNVVRRSSPTFADIDGDGDKDAFIGEKYGTILYYKNTATATANATAKFVAQTGAANPLNGVDVGDHSKFTFVDIDGDQDAFSGEKYGTILYYKNTGTINFPVFAAQTNSNNPFIGVDVGYYSTPTFKDIDGDGDKEAFIGADNGFIQYYQNTGTTTAPVFAAQTGANNPFDGVGLGNYSAPSFEDIDGDGDQDAFIGAGNGTINYYQNTGTTTAPVFAAQTGANNPFNGLSVGLVSRPIFMDIDRDGDQDAFSGVGSGVENGTIKYYQNTGTTTAPVFAAQTGANNPLNGVNVYAFSTPTLVDIDRDGDQDVFIGENWGTIKYYQNTGTTTAPVFVEQTGTNNPFNGVDVGYGSTPTFVDIDGDGDQDAFSGKDNGTILYYQNTGTTTAPVFTAQTGTNNPLNGVDVGYNSNLSFVDIDWDGDQDVFIGESNGTIQYYKNTGTTTAPVFAAQTGANNPFDGVDVGAYSNPTFVDIDGDGDKDAFSGEQHGEIMYYQNTATATALNFVAQTGAANPFNGVDVGNNSKPSFVDIDGDGDQDAFSGKDNGTILYYQNTGTTTEPVFAAQTGANNPLNGVNVYAFSTPTLVDIDGDGDQDAFIGENWGTIKHYQNTGTTTAPVFVEQTGTNNPFNGVDVGYGSTPTFVDIDGDGDQDAFSGVSDGTIKYYKNTGTTTSPVFAAQTGANNPLDGVDVGYNSNLSFVDIDGDGDQDAFSGESGGTIKYYKNTGTTTAPVFVGLTGANNPFAGVDVGAYSNPTFVDIDGDGDKDAFSGEQGGTILYYENTPCTGVVFTLVGTTSTRCQGAGTVSYEATNAVYYSLTGGGSSTINMSTGQVTWDAAFSGSATIMATGAGCNATHVVTVSPATSAPTITGGNTSVCVGASVTLTGVGTGGTATIFRWYKNGTIVNNSIQADYTFSALAGSNDYTLVVVYGGGCPSSVSSTATVVGATPPVFTLGASSTRCQGAGTVSYAATNAASYSLTGGGASTIDSGTGEVSWDAAFSGSATITAIGAGCNTTHVVTVTPTTAPTITAVNSPVCVGESVTLTGVGTGGTATEFSWYKNGTLVNSDIQPNYTFPALAGSNDYTLVVVYGGSCPSAVSSTTTVVGVTPPAFSLGASSTRCQGAGTVSYAATNALSYSLTGGGASTIDSGTGEVSWDAAFSGFATITAIGAGCNTTHVVTVNPLTTAPTITAVNSPVCVGESVTLTGVGVGGTATEFSWYKNGTLVNNDTQPNYTFSALAGSNDYTLVVVYGGSCSSSVSSKATLVGVTSPVFTLGETSTRCQVIETVSYEATNTASYSLTGGGASTINTSTGAVSWSPAFSGSATITAISVAPGCSNSTHVVTITPATTPPTITSGNTSVCVGAPVTITGVGVGSTATEFAWFKNGTFVKYYTQPDYTFNATEGPNNYTLVVIYGGSCPSTVSSTATVVTGNAPAAVITPSVAPPYCVGAAPTLMASTGTNYTYSWIGSSPTAATTTTSTFVPTSSGNHRVIVTDANGCSKTSAWFGISLNALPIANAGTDKSVCLGSSIGLGTTATAGYSYSWSPSISLSSAISAKPTFTPSVTGNTNYTVTVTNTTTGCINTDAVYVSAVALPTTPSLTSTSSPVCQGATITLIPSGATGAINWYKNGVLSSAAATAAQLTLSTSTTSADSYTIRAKSGTCLSVASNPVSAWIKPAPVPTLSATPAIVSNIVSVCNPGQTSGTAQLMVNLPSGAPSATYKWQQVVAGVATNVNPAATTSTYTAAISTTANNKVFRAEVTYSNGCVKSTSNVIVKLLPSTCTRMGHTADLAETLFTAYPNPTENMLSVSIQNSTVSEGEVMLYNILGQVITSRTILLDNGSIEESLDLSGLASGVYTLSFQTKDGNQVQKIVKE